MVNSRTRGDSFAYSSRDTKGVTSIFLKLAPVRVCEQLLLELCLDSVFVFIIYLKCDG